MTGIKLQISTWEDLELLERLSTTVALVPLAERPTPLGAPFICSPVFNEDRRKDESWWVRFQLTPVSAHGLTQSGSGFPE